MLFVASSALAASAAHGNKAGAAAKTPVYDLRDRSIPELYAIEYALKGEVRDIFPVPERCSVGTNSLSNRVTVLELSGPKVKYHPIVSDYTAEASSGSMVFLSECSADSIGYAKTRSFFLVNLKRQDVQRFKLAPILEYTIDDVAALDWARRLFAVSLNFTQSSGTETEVQVVDLSGPEAKILAALEIKKNPRWPRLGKTIFYFSQEGRALKLHALDERLREISHPLLEPFNKGFFPGEPDLPLVHPRLPFAVFATLERDLGPGVVFRVATWREKDRVGTVTIAVSSSGSFRFSPDGNWLLFEDGASGLARRMVMPVDSRLPHYLGPPVILATPEKIDDLGSNCAWLSDPPGVACVVNRTERISATHEDRPVNKLLKWDLSSIKR